MTEVICIDTPGTCDGRADPDNGVKFEAAVKAARALAEACGKGYRGAVWENIGWRHKAISPCGRIEVHYSRGYGKNPKPSYGISIHEPDGAGTSAAFGVMPSRSTPKAAIRDGVAQVRKYIKSLEALVEGL